MAIDVKVTTGDATERPQPVPVKRAERRGPSLRWTSAWILPALVVLFAATLRFAYLSHPERIYFDETYYANDANQMRQRGAEQEFAVHPPVGKWLIASGIAVFGFDSFGWRVASAAAGTLTVLMTYLIALRLFRKRGIAALAAFLLAIDGLALTMSRISMLDIFLTLFVTLGVWLLLLDRDRQWSLASGRGSLVTDIPVVSRQYRWLAGLAFGLALATKWSALLAIGGAGLFVLASELLWRRRLTGRWFTGSWRAIGSGLATLVLVPAVVYVASYGVWFANFENTRVGAELCPDGVCSVSVPQIATAWWDEQVDIFRFHRDLEATHNYRASAQTWPLVERPVVYYYESCRPDRSDDEGPCVVDPDNVEEIIGLGNPAIWWSALAAYPFLGFAAIRRRDWVAASILLFILAQYLPWLGPTRPLFFFYATPIVPFVVLALTWVATRSLNRPELRWVPTTIGVTALAAFIYWAPIYYGFEISEGAWRLRMWLESWI